MEFYLKIDYIKLLHRLFTMKPEKKWGKEDNQTKAQKKVELTVCCFWSVSSICNFSFIIICMYSSFSASLLFHLSTTFPSCYETRMDGDIDYRGLHTHSLWHTHSHSYPPSLTHSHTLPFSHKHTLRWKSQLIHQTLRFPPTAVLFKLFI